MNRRGNTLAGMLVVMVIIMILACVFMFGGNMFSKDGPKSPRKDGKGVTVPGLVEAKARDTVCTNNLSQIRQMVMVYQTSNDDHFPESLQELKVPSEMMYDPIGKEPYQYDPSTGQVHCVHPGHEKY